MLVCEDKYEAEVGIASADLGIIHVPSGLQFLDMERNSRATETNQQSHTQVCRQSEYHMICIPKDIRNKL